MNRGAGYLSKNCVYKLTSPSGKVYIGQTVDFNVRMSTHKQMRDGCPKLCNAIRKYGWENFEKKVLMENLTFSQMNFLEEFCISVFDSIRNGYNITIGGYGARGENGRNVNYGSGKYGVTKDDLNAWRSVLYENNKDKILRQQRENYKKHAEKKRLNARIYWSKYKDVLNARRREKYANDSSSARKQNAKQYVKNKDKKKKYNSEYYDKNKESIVKRANDILAGCDMMFSSIHSSKDAFRRIFIAMFAGGRTTTRRVPEKYHGSGDTNEWGDWLYKV